MRRRKGFTLVELVVVVLIVGVLAGVTAPKMFDTAGDARESALRQTLTVVRDAIELHRARAGGLPGNAGTEADFKADLVPYLRAFPKNPMKDDDTVSVKTDGAAFTGTLSGSIGWRYDNQSGEIIANSNGNGSDGRRYWQW